MWGERPGGDLIVRRDHSLQGYYPSPGYAWNLRVLHITPYYEAAWAYGGIPRVVVRLCRELAARGHEVTVCTTDAGDRDARSGGSAEAVADGVTVRCFPNLSNRLAYDFQFFTPMGLGRWLRSAVASFDIAHVHACHNLPAVIAGHHLRRAGVPYVVAANGTAPRIERRRLLKWLFDTTLGRQVLPGAARLIAVSEAEVKQLGDLGIDPGRIRIVPNPVDLAEHDMARDPEGFRRRIGIAPDRRMVLYLGKLTPRKRVDRLLDAFASLGRADLQLVVAGNDMGVGRQLRAQAERLGLTARVSFTGLLRGAQRLDAIDAAQVVVYPGVDEVFGLVALEALLGGRPVVVASDSGLGEIVRAVGGGLVVDTSHHGRIASALERMFAEPEEARRAARAAGLLVRERFSAPAVVAQLEAVYAEVSRDRAEKCA